ncbi:Trefoil factor 2, partial [Bos mutus]
QVEPHRRQNCGHPGITAKECKDKHCCFDNTVRGVPWCFHAEPVILSETCQVEPHQRRNCGHPSITAKECKEKGCCFDNTVRGVPWCF